MEDKIMTLQIQVWKITCIMLLMGKCPQKRRARLEQKVAFIFNVITLKFKWSGQEIRKAAAKEIIY